MIRIAAVGDIHVGEDTDGMLRRGFDDISARADVLLIAGDLTRRGTPDEASSAARELCGLGIPVLAVLGNHDHHDGRPEAVVDALSEAGVRVLEGHSVALDLPGGRLGVAGVKGFGGGFAGANATAFGEPEMKAFVHHTELIAGRLADALARLDDDDCDARVAVLHYSPVPDTLRGERLEIHPFLGSQLLGEVLDGHAVDLCVHGHAHAGSEIGATPGGVPVRNVAMPLIGAAYRVFELSVDVDRQRMPDGMRTSV